MNARCTYLLPIRRATFSEREAQQFAEYFRELACCSCNIVVVDGSPPDVFGAHAQHWGAFCRHVKVDRSFRCLNDKVNGVLTGVQHAETDFVILGDDDIRVNAGNVAQMAALLGDFDVVRPQNYLAPLSWWARMEAARMLINRATLHAADYPGAAAFRRDVFERFGRYDGDVLFDNEELFRHFARAGARICYANDLFLRKKPPTFRKWREQRPRQAYEDFPLRAKTILFWSVLPALVAAATRGASAFFPLLVALALGATALAFAGWRRGAARKFFPLSVCLFAPVWVLERSWSTHLAVFWFLSRGGYPFGDKVLSRGVGSDWFAGGKIGAELAASQQRNG